MKTLAITIGGAVSLGSFEAGVMYELLQALKQHNSHPDTKPDERIVVDAVTGASAGGMTAAITVQRMLFDAPALETPTGNAFYLPWVRSVSLAGLLALKSDEPSNLSVLSSDLIDDISRRFVTDRYAHGGSIAKNPHPAAADRIYLGMAMSNLSGIDYGVSLLTGGTFLYTRFQDDYVVPLNKTGDADDSLGRWEPIRAAAVACGAFPFAFRIREVQRSEADYPTAIAFPPTLGRYCYTDGGLFQNEPLGLTKNLVDLLDPTHAGHESRFYLFVAPGLRTSSMDNGEFVASDATFARTAERLVTVIFNQARYRDWVQVEAVNRKVQRLDEQAKQLVALIKTGRLSATALAGADASLLAVVYPDTAVRDAALARLRGQYQDEYYQLGGNSADPSTANEYIKALAVLEQILGVQNYDKMRVYSVSAGDNELAGSSLMAFAGFFDQSYRQHDYDMGRLKAQEFIAALNRSAANPPASPEMREPTLGPIRYSPDPAAMPAPDPKLNQIAIKQLAQDQRRKLKAQIQDRVNAALEEVGVGFIERAAIMNFVVSPKLDHLFGL